MLCDFEFAGWESDASGYGVVRAKDGKRRVLVEISTDYFDDLTGSSGWSAKKRTQALVLLYSHQITPEIEERYRANKFVEEEGVGSVFRVVRIP